MLTDTSRNDFSRSNEDHPSSTDTLHDEGDSILNIKKRMSLVAECTQSASLQSLKNIPEFTAEEKSKLMRSQSVRVASRPSKLKTSYTLTRDTGATTFFPLLNRQDFKQLHESYSKDKLKAEKEEKKVKRVTPILIQALKDINIHINKYINNELELEKVLNSLLKYMKQSKFICCIAFEKIEALVNSPQFNRKAVINLFEGLLEKLDKSLISKDSNIVDIIKRIGLVDEELYAIVQYYLKEVVAKQLIEFYLKSSNDPAVILAHPWFINTDFFIKILCKEAIDNPKDAEVLFGVVYDLINKPKLYHIPFTARSDLEKCFKGIPNNSIYKEIRHKLISAMCVPTHELNYDKTQQDFLNIVYETSHKHLFREATDAITGGNEGEIEQVVDNLALDLKKLEALLFNSISISEFATYKKEKFAEAIHITAYLQYTNALSHYVISQILSSTNPQERANCYEFFIKLMKKSYKLHNYNTAFNIFVSLENIAISRLKQTDKFINDKSKNQLAKMRDLFSSEHNYKKFRMHLESYQTEQAETSDKSTSVSIIPILALFLKDFTFIDDGNPTYLQGFLNADKISLLATQNTLLSNYQKETITSPENLLDRVYFYNIPNHFHNENNKIQRNSKGIKGAFEELMTLSCGLEPREHPRNQDQGY